MGRKLSVGEAIRAFQVTREELRRLERRGLIRPERTAGGHRRYDEGQLIEAILRARDGRGPGEEELGWTGLQGPDVIRLWEERSDALRGRDRWRILREMRDDPIIAAAFLAIENALMGAEWTVEPASEEPEDRRAAEFLESCIHDMEFSWGQTVQFALQMLEQGFALLEIVYKRRPDGLIGWRKLAPRPAETVEEWILDEHGAVRGIVQRLPNGEERRIPAEKLIHFRTTSAPANEPEGRPIHRAAYAAWWYTQQLQEIEGIGVERDLAGLPVVYLGEDCTLSGAQSDYQEAINLVQRLRRDEQAGVVFPKPKMGEAGPGSGILLELLSTGGRRQIDTSAIIERYDIRKGVATLTQFIMLGLTQRGGSFALARVQADLFSSAVAAWLGSIAEAFQRQAVPRLFAHNPLPLKAGLPRLKATPSGLQSLEEIASYLASLSAARLITPDGALEAHLRSLAGLPRASEERRGRRLDVEEASILLRRAALAARGAERLGVLTPEEIKELLAGPLARFREAVREEEDD